MTRHIPQWALKARTSNALSAKHSITQSKYDVAVVDIRLRHTREKGEERKRERKREGGRGGGKEREREKET